jgi:hypothetical protein
MIKQDPILLMIFLHAVDQVEVIAQLAISAAEEEVTRQTQQSLKYRLSRILPRHLSQRLFGWIGHHLMLAHLSASPGRYAGGVHSPASRRVDKDSIRCDVPAKRGNKINKKIAGRL